MSCSIQLTLKGGKPTYLDADQIYGIEKTPTSGSTLLLTVLDVVESYEEVKAKIEVASACERVALDIHAEPER